MVESTTCLSLMGIFALESIGRHSKFSLVVVVLKEEKSISHFVFFTFTEDFILIENRFIVFL